MKEIAIINTTGSPQGDMVLTGVYGSLKREPGEDGPGVFEVAPEFKRVSYLFTLLENGEAPVTTSGTRVLLVPEELELDVKAHLMHSLSARWANMYKQVNPNVPGLLNSMMTSESAKVAQGARSHLLSMGMRAYLVPLVVTSHLEAPGDAFRDEANLLQAAALRASTVQVDESRPVLDVGVEMMGVSPVQPAADQLPGSADQLVAPPQWSDFSGIEVEMNASTLIVARDMRSARELAGYFAAQHNNPAAGVRLACAPDSLRATRNMNLAMSFDDDDENDDYLRDR